MTFCLSKDYIKVNEGRDVHGIGKDGMEAKNSRQSSENHKVAMETLLDNRKCC